MIQKIKTAVVVVAVVIGVVLLFPVLLALFPVVYGTSRGEW